VSDPVIIGRYAVYGVIASGGMATVHYGRLVGPAGFSRTVAIKRLHPQFASDPALVAMMVDEARLASRIRHPNVVPTLDVVASGAEVLVVMEYVAGESLSQLRKISRLTQPIPIPIAAAIMADALRGLQAAHDARDEKGAPLGIVHRDVSPQNILVGSDGQARILDFGVAKAAGRSQTTVNGVIKGKIAYMSPEQISGGAVTLQTDLFAAAIVFWELLTGHRLFHGANAGEVAFKVHSSPIEPPSWVAPSRANAIAAYDALLARGLARDPDARFTSARQMREALEACGPVAPAIVVSDWLQSLAHASLSERAQALRDIEGSELSDIVPARDVAPASAASSSVPPAIEDRSPRAKTGARASLLWALVTVLGATTLLLVLLRHSPSPATGRTSLQPSVTLTAAAPTGDPPTAPETEGTSAAAGALAPSEIPVTSPRAIPSSATRRVHSAGPWAVTNPASVTGSVPPEASATGSSSAPAATACVAYTWDARGIKHYNPACL
jgi:serine/threonine protein kinase